MNSTLQSRLDLTILDSFEYLRTSAKRALLPFHLHFGKGKKVDPDLYKILLLIGLADKNEDDSDKDAAILPGLINRYENNLDTADLLNQLLTIFSYYALDRQNHPVLKRFKKHLKRFADRCGYEVHIVNIAKMAQQQMMIDSEGFNYQIWYDSFTPRSYQITQQAGQEQEFSQISKDISQTLKDHSSFFVLQRGDLVYKQSATQISKQKKLKKIHEAVLLGLAIMLGGISVVGDAVGSLYLSGLGPGILQLSLFFTGFYIFVGVPIFIYGTYQAMRSLFSGDFFKNLDGSDMSPQQLLGVAAIFVFCLCAALITGLVAIAVMAQSLPIAAGILAAFTVACATLSSWELCSEIYRQGVGHSFKKFWQRTFDQRLPLSQRIMRSVALVIALAVVVGILVVALPYASSFVATVFSGLGLAPAVVTTVTSSLLALATPVMTFQYTFYSTRAIIGLFDLTHAVGSAVKHCLTDTIYPKLKQGFSYLKDKVSQALTFKQKDLPYPLKNQQVTPSYQDVVQIQNQESKTQIQLFMQLQKIRATAANTFLHLCQGAAAYYNQGQPAGSHPNCLAITRKMGIPDTFGSFAIASLATFDVLTSAAPPIDETTTNATYTHELNSAPNAPSLSDHQKWTPTFFQKDPPPLSFRFDGYVLQSNPTVRL